MVYEKSRANHLSLCLAVLFLLIGRFQCAEVEECSAVEGQTYTIKCSGNTTGDKRNLVWHLYRQDGSEFRGSCSDNSCKSGQPENFSISILENGTTFNSLLTINNVTKDLDHSVVECNVLDKLLTIDTPMKNIKTFNLNVYHFPESFNCSVNDVGSVGVIIKCTQENGLPGMQCQISQFLRESKVAGVSVDTTQSETLIASTNIKYEDRSGLNSQQARHYASCTAEVYPDRPGRYRYKVEVSSKRKDATFALTHVYNTSYVNISMGAPSQGSQDSTIGISLYILITIIVVAVISLTVLGTLLVHVRRQRGYEDLFRRLHWPDCHSCQFSSNSNQNHDYEDISQQSPDGNHMHNVYSEENPEDNYNIYNEESPEDEDNIYSQASSEANHNVYNGESPEDDLSDCSDSTSWQSSEYAYPSATKDEYENLQDHNRKQNLYIIPCTPQSTPGEDRRTTTGKGREPGIYYNESPRSNIGSDRDCPNSENSPAPDSPMVNPAGGRKDDVRPKRYDNHCLNDSRKAHRDPRGNKAKHGHGRHKHRQQKRPHAAASVPDEQASDMQSLLQPTRTTTANNFPHSEDKQSHLQDNARATGDVHYDEPYQPESLNLFPSWQSLSTHNSEDDEHETVPKRLATENNAQSASTELSSMVARIC